MRANLQVLVCLLLLQQCTVRSKESASNGDAEPLTLLAATAQAWTAGVKGGGSGTEYRFTLVVNTEQPIQVAEVVLADKSYSPLLTKPGAPVGQAVVPSMGDTLNIRISVPGSDAPRADRGVVRYTVSEQPRTIEVPKIDQLAPQNRP